MQARLSRNCNVRLLQGVREDTCLDFLRHWQSRQAKVGLKLPSASCVMWDGQERSNHQVTHAYSYCRTWRHGPAWPAGHELQASAHPPTPCARARAPRARAPYASISSIMVTVGVSFPMLWGHCLIALGEAPMSSHSPLEGKHRVR